jgi:predicted glycoside hydrolase/deacetylase ChbG (UPF0249 family)
MRRLIVNADDFGLSEGVDDGIIEAHVRGVVTSTSLMVDRPAASHAASVARRHPALSVGLHFEEEESVDLDDPAQAARAFAGQLKRFRALTGRDPTHVDSHHHVHAEGERMQTFRSLVAPLGVPLRHDGHVAYIGGFYAQWEERVTKLRYVSRPFLVSLVRDEALEDVTELGCHPARLTGDFHSLYEREREVELATLTSPGLREEIEALGVRLVSFHDWR